MKYKKTICSLFLILPFLGVFAACTKEEIVINLPEDIVFWEEIKNIEDGTNEEYEGDGEYLRPVTFEFTVARFGEGVFNPMFSSHYAQGLSIYDNTLYQLYDGGYSRVYDLTNDIPTLVNEYTLGSCIASNHAGSCQFKFYEEDVEKQYLYVAAGYSRDCYIEKINRDSSILVQTITAEVTELMPDGMLLALQIGDDGYLWGNGRIGNTLYNYKFRKVFLAEGDQVSLTDDDIIDHWIVENYDINHYMRQGFKYKYGLMFFLYGFAGTDQHRGIDIYDLGTHEIVGNISLDNITSDELEGIEVIGRNIYVTTLSDYGLKITLDNYLLDKNK